jgi:hypothetical protein
MAAAIPVEGVTSSADAAAEPESLQRVGRYKILQKLGEGGYGVVYMAEQMEPVRRRVALKVLKLGMDTRQVIARFEAERQALALMDHPNIARVLDAGATSTGRPYFVMELVKGVRISDFCDQHHLPTHERLRLFMQVCQAIQHAHQKGIIHRDIKPSNILVTLHDGVPVPKVIDFGIAKATEQPLTEKTLFTAFGQFIGTPAYMSPEQAELSGLDVDTRSDIYGLGVLLYELLTGRTPFDAKELLRGGLDELRRRIREDEPLRPSTRLNTMNQADLTQVAHQRHSDPGKLSRFIRGDLDWIVMKCLEKDRTRRYETANGLAMDIQRHLTNEPVVACPPSAAYRFEKFVRRNKLGAAAASGVTLALLIGLGASTWLWLKEREAHAEMRQMRDFFRKSQVLRVTPPQERLETAPGATNTIPNLVLPGDVSRLCGRTYEQWAGAWWRWALEMPVTSPTGAVHPWKDSPAFDVAGGQTDDVWFLGAPFGRSERSCQVPQGKSLFIMLVGVESSSIEAAPFYGETSDDQAAIAQYWVGHATGVFCEVDGIALRNLPRFRVLSPQISITVPAPWILGQTGGKGTSRGDGYFVFLSPLPPGEHTIHFGGKFRFSKPQDPVDLHEEIDMTYKIRVNDPSVTDASGYSPFPATHNLESRL